MNFFKDSTQNKKWISSKEALEKESMRKIKQVIRKIGDLNNSQKISSSNPSEHSIIKVTKAITLQEEKLFLEYFSYQIIKIINSNIHSRSLKTYALTYFKRFFLKKTVLDYDPDYLLCAALFLGGKVAQLNINYGKMIELCPFLGETNTSTNKSNFEYLIDYEFYLSTILNYDFYVFCPYKAMIGFLYQLKESKEFITDYRVNIDIFEAECEKKIDMTFLTDLIFRYSYSIIALSCIVLASEMFNIPNEIIAKCLNLNSMASTGNGNAFDFELFVKEKVSEVKEALDSLKIIDENEFREYKKKVLRFSYKYPQYMNKLNDDRKNLLKKMSDFEVSFMKGVEQSNNNNANNELPKSNNNNIRIPLMNNEMHLINNKRHRDKALDNDNMIID